MSLLAGKGLILSNGEFGERLQDHARRMGLTFDALEQEWGQPYNTAALESATSKAGDYAWLWAVHCETSTGVLNHIDSLKKICSKRGMKLALDCISSIGTVPIDLSGVYLATCASGKGLKSYLGLSMVYYNHHIEPKPDRLPRYLDLGLYAANRGIPFTTSSNLFYALNAALDQFDSGRDDVFCHIQKTSDWLRDRLNALGLRIVAEDTVASPAVITLALPETYSSQDLGDRLERGGFLLNYYSEYLRSRNWLQICLMGDFSKEDVQQLIDAVRREATAHD